MGLIASLDIGSEKMVMALASADASGVRLTGIKFVASQGVERGMVIDKEKVQACIRVLMGELVKDRHLDVLNIALCGRMVEITEKRIQVPLQRKAVEQADIDRAEQRCRNSFEGGREELVDVIPVAYSVDRGDLIANPLGKRGRNLEVTYQVYTADYDQLESIRKLFDVYDIKTIDFYPAARAYSEALGTEMSEHDFALVDIGAMHISIVLFREGVMEYEATLPLGMRTIDNDITSAFGINYVPARKLKHEYGQALRSECKNKKVIIPDTKLTVESRDLATVVQSRAEELMEGVVYLLQHWGFDVPEDEILLTGGGSRLLDIDVLTRRLSGHPVGRAKVRRVQTSREEVLRTPEYFVALGLLLCARRDFVVEGPKWPRIFKDLFNLFVLLWK